MKYRAVIFDLDGVLCHTDRFHFLAWQALANRLGLPFDEETNHRLRGVSRTESLEIILGASSKRFSPEEKTRMAEEKNAVYRRYLEKMSPADLSPEVARVLHSLRAAGIRLAIGSSSKNARTILDRLGITELFDAISDGNGLSRSKPDPEVFLRAAELLHLSPAECLVVEDAPAGVEAGHTGGFDTAGLGEAGMHPSVTYQISSLSELEGAVAFSTEQKAHRKR